MDLPASLRSICSSCSSGMAETFLLLDPFHYFPTQNLFFFELATFSLSFWSSVQAKRASESIFFLVFFSFWGANGYRNQSPLLGLSDFRGVLLFFSFLFFSFLLFWGRFGGNGISLPQLEALENTGHEQAWRLQRLLTSKQARARGSRKYFTGGAFC